MFVPKRTESSCAELVPSEFWLIYFPRFFFSAPKKTRGVSPSPTEGTGCSSTCGESRLSGTAFQGAAPQLLWGRAPSRTRRLNGQEDEAPTRCAKSSPNIGVSLNGGTPKSSILIGFSIINHPFWGFPPIFGNTHMCPKPKTHGIPCAKF